MNTSVNSETWIRVGSRMPSTPSEPLVSMNAVSTIAPMNSTMACSAVVVATIKAHATNARHITRPNHVALSMIAATNAIAARPSAMPRWGRKYLRSCSQDISVA